MAGQHASRRSFLRQVAGTSTLLLSRRGLGLAEVTPAATAVGPPVGLGVVGLGVWGREILSTLSRLGAARVVAVCDTYAPSHKKALEIAPSAAALADARALIDRADVEAVVVATPSHRHREIAVTALAAGKHVYCEAPLAASLDDARAIECPSVTRLTTTGRIKRGTIENDSRPATHAIAEIDNASFKLDQMRIGIIETFGYRHLF